MIVGNPCTYGIFPTHGTFGQGGGWSVSGPFLSRLRNLCSYPKDGASRVLFASHPGHSVRLLKSHNRNSQRNVHFIDCESTLLSPAPAAPSHTPTPTPCRGCFRTDVDAFAA